VYCLLFCPDAGEIRAHEFCSWKPEHGGVSLFKPVVGSPESECYKEQLMIESLIFDAILFIYKVMISDLQVESNKR